MRSFLSRAGNSIAIILGMEIAYFLSGYIFWYQHNLNSFAWSGQYTFFPQNYYQGFLILALLSILIPLFPAKVNLTQQRLLSLLFCASFVNALSLLGIPEINPDAILWNYMARFVADNSVFSFLSGFGTIVATGAELPIPPLIFGLAYSAFGPHRIIIQLVNAVFFALIPVLGYLTAKQLISEKVAKYAGIILISSPFMVAQAPLFLVDIISTFFVALSVYLIVCMSRSRSPMLPIFAALAVGLTVLSKISLIFIIFPVLLVLLVIEFFRSRDRNLLLKNVLLFIVPLLVISILVFPMYSKIIRSDWSGIDPLTFVTHPSLLSGSPTNVLGFAIPKSLMLSVSIPVFTIAIISVCYVLLRPRKGELRAYASLFVWIVFPTVYLLDPFSLNSAARYLMPTFSAYAILAGSMLSKIKDMRARRMMLGSILLFSILSAHLMYGYAWNQSVSGNLMHAANFLQQNAGPNSTVRICSPLMAGWMSIYTGAMPPSDSLRIGNLTLFQCLNPNEPLPRYLVLINAWTLRGGDVIISYPRFSPPEKFFLDAHYVEIETFHGGNLEGPWQGLTVEIYHVR